MQIDDLKCCGNCGNITTINCPHYSVGMLTSDYEVWMCCDKWSTDGLNKHERDFPYNQKFQEGRFPAPEG